MKKNTLPLLLALWLGSLPTAFSQNTSGDNSPAVIAKNFSAQYDVRPDAILAVLWVYEQEGYDPQERKRRTEAVIKMYKETPEKKQGAALLSDNTKNQLGLAPAIADALDWDLFVQKNYLSLSTTGMNSPAVVAGGDVNIWYGIPPKVVRALADYLEKNKVDIADLGKRLGEQVKKYEELKAEFEAYGPIDPIVKKAEQLLEEGKLLEVEKLLDSNLEMEDKRLAYRHFLAGETKELLLKYDTAAIHFRKAIVLDPQNAKYLLNYAFNEHILAHYDEAIEHYQRALAIDTVVFKDKPEKAALLYNNLGEVYHQKGEHDRAITFFEKALPILIQSLGEKHPNVAGEYNNLGSVWQAKGKYDRAIAFYEKALAIDSVAFGNKHPNVANRFNNLGAAWQNKGEYDRAIAFFKKALAIDSVAFGNKHPSVATQFNNLGETYRQKGEHDRAIAFFEKALAIDSVALGNKHPSVATQFNNLGEAYRQKGEHDRAITFFEKALAIDSVALGNKHPNVAIDFNNLGVAWQDKGKYDRAIAFFEKALPILIQPFGEKHPNVASQYNNLGVAWQAKGEHDRAIAFHEKALAIDSVAFGNKHPNVANRFNNLGMAWKAKGEHDRAIAFYEKALPIFVQAFGEKHPSVAIQYGNLGAVWQAKGECDRAIAFFEKALDICKQILGNEHPNTKTTARNLSRAANDRGMEFFREKNYAGALPCFQKALENAEQAEDWDFSFTCLNNIGSMQKRLGQYAEGLATLEKGLTRAEKINLDIDEEIKKLPLETLQKPEVQAKIAELKNTTLLRRMRYHKAGCLAGLGRRKEAEELYQQLLKEAKEANDARLLEDLKNDGVKD